MLTRQQGEIKSKRNSEIRYPASIPPEAAPAREGTVVPAGTGLLPTAALVSDPAKALMNSNRKNACAAIMRFMAPANPRYQVIEHCLLAPQILTNYFHTHRYEAFI